MRYTEQSASLLVSKEVQGNTEIRCKLENGKKKE